MSTKPFWKVRKQGGSNWSNWETLTIDTGRRNVTDNFKSTIVTITGRVPSSLPTLALDDVIIVEAFYQGDDYPAVSQAFSYTLTDFTIEYGVLPEMDTWTVQLQDFLGVAGRSIIDISWASGVSTFDAFSSTMTALGGIAGGVQTSHYCNAQTIVAGNGLDILQTLANTERAELRSNTADSINFFTPNWSYQANLRNWTDTGTGTFPVSYNQLEFRGIADNFANKVVVNIRGGNTVDAGTGNFSYEYDTYSNTDGVAQDNAEYVLNMLNASEQMPFMISAVLDFQAVTSRASCLLLESQPPSMRITFRSNTYDMFVLGSTITATVERTRCTHYLAPRSSLAALILDDTNGLGTLDNNKLGF